MSGVDNVLLTRMHFLIEQSGAARTCSPSNTLPLLSHQSAGRCTSTSTHATCEYSFLPAHPLSSWAVKQTLNVLPTSSTFGLQDHVRVAIRHPATGSHTLFAIVDPRGRPGSSNARMDTDTEPPWCVTSFVCPPTMEMTGIELGHPRH